METAPAAHLSPSLGCPPSHRSSFAAQLLGGQRLGADLVQCGDQLLHRQQRRLPQDCVHSARPRMAEAGRQTQERSRPRPRFAEIPFLFLPGLGIHTHPPFGLWSPPARQNLSLLAWPRGWPQPGSLLRPQLLLPAEYAAVEVLYCLPLWDASASGPAGHRSFVERRAEPETGLCSPPALSALLCPLGRPLLRNSALSPTRRAGLAPVRRLWRQAVLLPCARAADASSYRRVHRRCGPVGSEQFPGGRHGGGCRDPLSAGYGISAASPARQRHRGLPPSPRPRFYFAGAAFQLGFALRPAGTLPEGNRRVSAVYRALSRASRGSLQLGQCLLKSSELRRCPSSVRATPCRRCSGGQGRYPRIGGLYLRAVGTIGTGHPSLRGSAPE